MLSVDVNVASTILANGRSHGGHTIHLFIWSSTNILSYKIRFYPSPIHINSLYLRADVFTCLFFVETSSISNSSKFSLSATTKLCLQHLRYIIFGSVHTRSVHMSRSNSIRVLWPMADSLLFTLISLPENHLKNWFYHFRSSVRGILSNGAYIYRFRFFLFCFLTLMVKMNELINRWHVTIYNWYLQHMGRYRLVQLGR